MYLKDENAPYTIQISSLKYDIYPLFIDKSGITFSLKRTTQKQMVILYQKQVSNACIMTPSHNTTIELMSTHLLTLPHQIRL